MLKSYTLEKLLWLETKTKLSLLYYIFYILQYNTSHLDRYLTLKHRQSPSQ